MSQFQKLSVVDALERSIANATHLRAVHSAHVAAARVLAKRIDDLSDNGFVDENGKLDNVSLPSFLKYLDAMGISADPPVAMKAEKTPATPKDQIAAMRKKLQGAG